MTEDLEQKVREARAEKAREKAWETWWEAEGRLAWREAQARDAERAMWEARKAREKATKEES